MVMTVLAPIGGIESALVPLTRELKTLGHEVIVYVIEPIRLPNQNAAALRLAETEIIQPHSPVIRAARYGETHKTSLIRFVSILASPALCLLAGGDALFRRRSWLRSVRGAFARLEGIISRRLDFTSLYYARLRTAFRHKPADVVHVHGWGCGEDPPDALQALRRFPFPIVYTEHNSPDPERTGPICDAPMNLADVLVAVSQAGRVGLSAVGQARRPIVVIPYGVEPLAAAAASRSESKAEFVIACVARLTPQKGHRDLIKAMVQVARVIPGARLWLVGDGPLSGELKTMAQDLDLKERVLFRGIVNRSDLPALFTAVDVVALASYWEGLPVSLMEAMSAGKAIIASHVGGNPELVVDEDNGLLFPPGDVDALARALIRLGQNPDLVRRMGESSRHRFELGGFSPRDVASTTLNVYQQARRERTQSGSGSVPEAKIQA